MRQILAATSIIFALSAPQTFARETVTILGQKVEAKDVKEFEDALLINGKSIHQNEYVALGDSYKLADGAVAIVGTSSAGGNRCAPEPFVLLIKPDGTHRLDGPIDTCMPFETAKQGEQLLFETARGAGMAKQKWVWSAKAGFKKR
jgi:hypothetical protein